MKIFLFQAWLHAAVLEKKKMYILLFVRQL